MKHMIRVISLLLITLMISGCRSAITEQDTPENHMVLSFITIGKGDAFLLTSPEGNQYLIDTGKRSDFPQIARFLRLKGVETLDGIFLSHGHLDHAGGIEALLNLFAVKKIYLSAVDSVSYKEIDVEALAKTHDIPVEELTSGEVLTNGEMSIRCWLPNEAVVSNENDNSVILRICYGETAFLMMGDAELNEETALLDSGEEISANILKLGHHGENDATSLRLLEKVKPQYGLITGNQAENPESIDPEVAAKLRSFKIKPIYSECEGLGIDFCSDGTKITMQTVTDQENSVDTDLSFSEFDQESQKITIKNNGPESILMDGYILFSARGGESFHFPDGIWVMPGECITVSCRNTWTEGELLWDEDKVWKKNDAACLYDCNFILLDEISK